MPATPDDKYKVLIVDDNPVVRISIRTLLEKIADFEIVGEAENGEDAVSQAQNLNPDIILMDVGMPIMNGIEASRAIHERNKTAKVVMLTSHDSETDIFESFAAGADGYVLKSSYASTLELAMRTVGFGSVWLDPAIARRVLQVATSQRTAVLAGSTVEPLSDDEKEVLSGVAESHCEDGVCMIEPTFLDKLRRFAKQPA